MQSKFRSSMKEGYSYMLFHNFILPGLTTIQDSQKPDRKPKQFLIHMIEKLASNSNNQAGTATASMRSAVSYHSYNCALMSFYLCASSHKRSFEVLLKSTFTHVCNTSHFYSRKALSSWL